jgi:hypothetical protein
MFVEFMLLETYIYDLPFSYMGMTGLLLCAGYRWNCEENWQEGCTCGEYKCLVNLSPAYTKHALIFHILSIILATQTLNLFKGCIFQKKMILVSLLIQRRSLKEMLITFLLSWLSNSSETSIDLCYCANTIIKGLLIAILWQYVCAIWKHGVCWASFWSGIRCKKCKIPRYDQVQSLDLYLSCCVRIRAQCVAEWSCLEFSRSG